LISVLFLQQIDRKDNSIVPALLAGATLVVPLFVKQNTGLAFLLSAIVLVTLLAVFSVARRQSARRFMLILVGAFLTLAVAILLINYTAGLKNYLHWTIRFAAERRTPARTEMLGIYFQWPLLIWFAFFAVTGVLLWLSRKRNSFVLAVVAAVMFVIPFAWP